MMNSSERVRSRGRFYSLLENTEEDNENEGNERNGQQGSEEEIIDGHLNEDIL